MRVVLFCLLFSPLCYADSIVECVDRGRVALDVARAVQEGMKIENINFAFPNARPEDQEAAQAWGEILKSEVALELETAKSPELAAQKVMERCAYEYGKAHSMMRKISLESDGVTQFCWAYISTLKRLYKAVKQDGTEQVIAAHPPGEDGVGLEYARRIGAEIEADERPSAWLEGKWKACIADPQSVR